MSGDNPPTLVPDKEAWKFMADQALDQLTAVAEEGGNAIADQFKKGVERVQAIIVDAASGVMTLSQAQTYLSAEEASMRVYVVNATLRARNKIVDAAFNGLTMAVSKLTEAAIS